jgi:CheY-like chemotaxis protein
LANIVIIDDDYAIGILAENLHFNGHNVRIIESATDALADIEKVASADIIILDIIMEYPKELQTDAVSGGRSTGMVIFSQVRALNQSIPIIAYSGTHDHDLIMILKRDKNTRFIPKWSAPSLKDIFETIDSLLGVSTLSTKPTVFIVHGHDDKAKLELKNYLQNTIGLPEPIILHEQPNMGRTIIEKFEDYALSAELAFILLTPDDVMATNGETDDEKRRARQNVIFEMGYFLGVFGRHSGRVILLYKKPLDLPTDLSGVTYIDISDGIEAAGESIRKELNNVVKG